MENPFPESHESLWRRRLPAADQAKLHAQPELELEARLTEALARLPQAPVPSNFTARVLAAIELEEARATRKTWTWRWNWHAILPRFTAATAVLLVAGLGIQRYETGQHRAQLARSLSVVASAQTVPSVEALENLEVIQRMSQPAHADADLLVALQ
jgi:negative regulator of sigma E activity